MPIPTSPPAIPPTAAPTAAPLSAAIIGPAAIKGPTPGIANAPIPAIHPNAPPTTPPVPAPATAPSGAFVFFSCAKSRVVPLSGNSTEMSLLEKFTALSSSTICSACSREVAMQNTDFFDIYFIFFCLVYLLGLELVVARGVELHFQLVVHILGARDTICDFPDETFFLGGIDRPAQSNLAVFGDDLHVPG